MPRRFPQLRTCRRSAGRPQLQTVLSTCGHTSAAGLPRVRAQDGGKAPLTLAELVDEYSIDQRQTAQRAIRLGKLTDSWRLRPAGKARSIASRSSVRGEVHLPRSVNRRSILPCTRQPLHPLLLGRSAVLAVARVAQLFRPSRNATLDRTRSSNRDLADSAVPCGSGKALSARALADRLSADADSRGSPQDSSAAVVADPQEARPPGRICAQLPA